MKIFHRRNKPFIILSIIHSCLFILILNKTENKKSLFSLLLSNIGFAYVFEYFVLNLFHAYTYYPKIFKKHYLNNVLGAMVSQAILIPITSTLITLFKLNGKWKLLFASYFACVEKVFIYLKVYKNHWWKTRYTLFILIVHFYMSDFWFKLLKRPIPIVKSTSTFVAMFVTHLNILFFYTVFRLVRFGYKKYDLKEHAIIDPLYSLVQCIGYTVFAIYRNGFVRALALVFIFLVDKSVVKWSLIKNKTSLLYILTLHAFMLFIGRKLYLMISLNNCDSEE